LGLIALAWGSKASSAAQGQVGGSLWLKNQRTHVSSLSTLFSSIALLVVSCSSDLLIEE